MPTIGQTVIPSQHSHIALWPLSPTLLSSYTNPGTNFIRHGPVTCLCYIVMYLQCSNSSSSSLCTSQRTQAHKSRCDSLTHTKGMISNILGIKSKSQGHFQHKLLFKVPNTSPASQSTAQKARVMRIKEELKFLHKKKEMLNRELYRRHLQVAQEWGRWWNVIHESILQKINTEMERKYKIMD